MAFSTLPFRFTCGVWLAIASAWTTAPAHAQVWPAAEGREVDLYLWLQPQRALTPVLREQVRSAVSLALQTALGREAKLDWLTSVEMDDWLSGHKLKELTAAQCLKLGLDRRPKTVLLTLELVSGGYHIAAAEYDDWFTCLGPVREVQVLQREMVPELAARLALQSWSAVGEVSAFDAAQCGARFREPAHPAALAWPASGDVLQICRQVLLKDGIKPTTCRSQFLVVQTPETESSGNIKSFAAKLEKASWETAWFTQWGHPRVRYLARRLDAQRPPLTVEVRLAGSQEPREGCEVYLASQAPTSAMDRGKRLGQTDARGQLSFTHAADSVFYVTVLYDDLVATRACAHGGTMDPLLFTVEPREGRMQFELKLERSRQDLQNRRFQLARLRDDMSTAGKAFDVSQAERLYSEALGQFSLEDFRSQLERTRSLARIAGVNLDAKVDALLKEADQLEADDSKPDLKRNLHLIRTADVKRQIQEAAGEKKWDKAGKLMEQLCQMDPGNAPARAMLAQFQTAYRTRDAEHARARQTMQRLARPRNIEVFLKSWAELKGSLVELLSREDRILLDVVSVHYDSWLQLIKDDLLRIANIAMKPVTEAEKLTLEARKAELVDTQNELAAIIERADKLLEAGVLPAPP